MKTISFLCFSSILFLAISCKHDDDNLILLNEVYELNFGLTTTFEEGGFEIRFDKISESRCPSDVVCWTGGMASVDLIVEKNSINTGIKLITFNEMYLDTFLTATYGNYLFELKEVNPYPADHLNPTPEEEYSVVFSINEL